LAHDIYPLKSPGLCIDLFFDLGDGFLGKVDSKEDDLGIDAVFGLGEEISSDECWVGGFISNNLDMCINPNP